ncbi:MAG: dihydrolipoyl dehydrogenase, partial [Pseudobdellovibrionaceae bacterium]
LAGGAIFGFTLGLFLVSISSTIGATLAFLAARYLLNDTVNQRFGDKLKSFNEGVKKDGAFYLFTLRLAPVFPFFIVNLLMGLTPIRMGTYFLVSMICMLPVTAAYVNAGTQLSQIDSLKGILSQELIFSFLIIAILPLLSKKVIEFFRSRMALRKYSRPQKFDFNVIVIGAGSAGLVTSYIAAAIKAKVALIENHKMGGDCLNTGCVPSKALIRSAKLFSYLKRGSEFGFQVEKAEVNFPQVMQRIQSVIKAIEPHDSVERYTKLGVDCIQGKAKIRTPYEVEVNGNIITAKNIVIATGARPLVPAIPGVDQIQILTSDTIWNLKQLPESLVILGGGAIGCEIAQSFARFGTKVTLIEKSLRLLPREDADVSEVLEKKFRDEGIQILTNHSVERFEASPQIIHCQSDGSSIQIAFKQVLFALGRKPNVEGFGLEELGIELCSRGTIAVDDYLRTVKFPNIYACGDVVGPFQFTHMASHQAWFTAVNSLFSPLKKFKVDYRVVPWCTFTDPEIARVGLSENEAKEKNIAYEVTRYEIDDLDRAIADGEAHGFVKVLTVPGSDRILGATIVGDHAGDIISEYVTAMKHSLGLNKILGTIHIYPTFAEANKYAAGVWKREHAPEQVLNLLQKFHAWRRS